jgi:hypothetical protein
LAGIFMLRVCIEQYWRERATVENNLPNVARPTGDQLGDAYNLTLPDDFKQRVPSLSETYGSLSQAIHSANESESVFMSAASDMEMHFDARRLYKLDDRPAAAP